MFRRSPLQIFGSLLFATLSCDAALAQVEPKGLYITLYGQYSRIGSSSLSESGPLGAGNGLRAEFGSGAGLGADIGWRYGNGWAAEVEWNYRRHDLKSLSGGSGGASPTVTEGDFASSILFINGFRRFPSALGGWTPYVGAGVGWVQEIDFDLNSAGTDRAWSKQGKIGLQLIAGAEIPMNKDWRLTADVRMLRLGSVELPAEEGATGRLSKPDYNPVSVQLGLRRMF
jgi:opacity protein-like surface antigen